MKPTDLSNALNEIDPAFIDASAPEPAAENKKAARRRTRIAALAAALAVLIGIGTAVIWRGAKHPSPSVPETAATQQRESDKGLSALLRPLTGLRIVAPTCVEEMAVLLDEALSANGPTAIRYPKGIAPRGTDVETGDGSRVMLCAVGDQVEKAVKVKRLLAAKGVGAEVMPVSRVKPAAMERPVDERLLVTFENGVVIGGFGESVSADMTFGWPDAIVGHGTVAELEREFGFDAETIAAAIIQRIRS